MADLTQMETSLLDSFSQIKSMIDESGSNISKQLEELIQKNSALEKELNDIKTSQGASEGELGKLKKENEELRNKYTDAQSKVTKIESQMSSTVQKLETVTKAGQEKPEIDSLKLLDIYLVLMGQVFDSAPHVRLLLILHGARDEYTLADLAQASGISGLQVRTCVFELRNAGIVSYDEDQQIVRLINRFI